MNTSVGKPVNRVDGRLKVTGGARYSAEIPIEGVVHGVFLTSTIARGNIKTIDTGVAERSPGVLAVLTHLNIPKLAKQPTFIAGQVGVSFAPLQSPQIHFSGQPIAIVIADTLERAGDAPGPNDDGLGFGSGSAKRARYCTPSILYFLWRSPMISPSSVQAVTSRQAGSDSRSTTSEW